MTLAPQVIPDEETRVADVSARLRRRFPGIDSVLIAQTVEEVYQLFDGARIRDFVPILVEKHAGDLLREAQC
jgi:hypothetical protein